MNARVVVLALVLGMALAACGFNKPDVRYRDSQLLAPLAVPEGLATPGYSTSMDIPPAGTAPPPEDDGAVVRDGLAIEQPPDLREETATVEQK